MASQEQFGFYHPSLGLNFFTTSMCIRKQNVVRNIPGLSRTYFMQTESNMAIMRNTTKPCFTRFCFEAHCQLHRLFTPSHFWFNALWLVCFRLSIFYYGNIIFDLRLFALCQLFSGTQLGLKTIYSHPRHTTTYGGEQTVALFWGLTLCLLNYCK
jgi:hypothetical protein